VSAPKLYETFLRQFALASAEVEKLRLLYPGCFDENGRAIVASAHLPRHSTTQNTGGGKP
jgi:hypothetical protein